VVNRLIQLQTQRNKKSLSFFGSTYDNLQVIAITQLEHPMSTPHASHQPSLGTNLFAPNGPWSYNDMVHIVTHEAPSCNLCAEWAQHYTTAAIRKDRSLRDAERQRSAALSAQLLAENTTLRDDNASLRAELDATRTDAALLREELDAARLKLSSAEAEIHRLRDLNDDRDRGVDETLRGLKDQIRDLEQWGHAHRRRKMPRRHSRSHSPSSDPRSRRESRLDSSILDDRDVLPTPSSAAPSYLLTRMDLPADTSPARLPVDPSPSTSSDPASHMANAVSLEPATPHPAPSTNRLAAAPSCAAVGFPSLHPIVSFSGHQYRCTALDAAGKVDVDPDAHFVYATGSLSEDGPAWTKSLITRDHLKEESTLKVMVAAVKSEQPDTSTILTTPLHDSPDLPLPSSPSSPMPLTTASSLPLQSPPASAPSQLPPLRRSTRIRKPSRLVRDLQSAMGACHLVPESVGTSQDSAARVTKPG
jgi:hypothetical protein